MANLVETIADEIGEDGRLACVSAYYHDIGKIENPLYFIENTNKDDNSAYYTPQSVCYDVIKELPDIEKETISSYPIAISLDKDSFEYDIVQKKKMIFLRKLKIPMKL